MAESPSHKFGQIIGKILEDLFHPTFKGLCDERNLYLDKGGIRNGVRDGKKLTWEDKSGNRHDLDFVIEKGATSESKGRPVAFIEVAWRRYKRHSRNKVQEIQGALLPMADTYDWDRPFLGVVLAGEFTEPSINQLRSVGFHVLHFPYNSIVAAFDNVGVDARFDESTSTEDFRNRVGEMENLSEDQYIRVREHLKTEQRHVIDGFLNDLAGALDRSIDSLVVTPLFGENHKFESISDAVTFLQMHQRAGPSGALHKYEILVKYSNGDRIDASFRHRKEVEEFLQYLGT